MILALMVLLVEPKRAAAQVFEVQDGGVLHRTDAPSERAPPPAPASSPVSLDEAVIAAAKRFDLSPDLLRGLIAQESAGQAAAVSPKGALGLTQLMPGTARTLGVDPHDPVANIFGGAAYLRQQLDRFNGRLDLALAAYNAGPKALIEHGGAPPYAETRRYLAANLDRLAAISVAAPTNLDLKGLQP